MIQKCVDIFVFDLLILCLQERLIFFNQIVSKKMMI